MRAQRTRLLQVKGQVASTGYTVQSAANQVAMGQTMARSSAAMSSMNQQMNIAGLQAYTVESSRMGMKAEMSRSVSCHDLIRAV